MNETEHIPVCCIASGQSRHLPRSTSPFQQLRCFSSPVMLDAVSLANSLHGIDHAILRVALRMWLPRCIFVQIYLLQKIACVYIYIWTVEYGQREELNNMDPRISSKAKG